MTEPHAEMRVDQALVARVLLDGDRRAFEQLMRRHQGMIRAQLRRLANGDMARADDLAQETFLTVWRKLHQYRGDARFSTWLYRVAYTCFLQARRKNSWAEVTAPEPDRTPHAAAAELRLDVERAMRQLSEAERTVLLHCVQMGLSQSDAAYVLDMPLGTVKSHMTRGKEKLRASLADWREPSREKIGS
ncbi:MAG: RNA polymerase sigma factor [Proteobacteria bacterium]|nr:RNA polymerase sigma factor [Pseudomonadota bacterium]